MLLIQRIRMLSIALSYSLFFIFGRWIRLDDTKHGDILVSMIWKPITQNTGIPPPDHPVHPVLFPSNILFSKITPFVQIVR